MSLDMNSSAWSSSDGNSSYRPGTVHPLNLTILYNDSSGEYSLPPLLLLETRTQYEVWETVIIVIILGAICIGTIIGNVLVCTAVCIVRKLRTPSNLLIVSLAVSDLLVGLLVMPFAASYEVTGKWLLGRTICDMWTSMDILLCTASILNLFMISVDRYFVITRPFQYAMKRTPRRMATMITLVWISAALISIPPLFGWREEPSEIDDQCAYSTAAGYQFYATILSFYLPDALMILIYYRIYLVSSRIAEAEARSHPTSEALNASRPSTELNHNCPNGKSKKNSTESSMEMLPKKNDNGMRRQSKFHVMFHRKNIQRSSSSRERKATKTLGVIMGAFTACWLPFFILAPISPFCNAPDCIIPGWLESLFLWMGYANSLLNPIIYARFNREFRTPFGEILLCRCIGINTRLRHESYAEQYGAGVASALSRAPCADSARNSLKPPIDTIVRYNSEGQTLVKLGANGDAADNGENPAQSDAATHNPEVTV